MEKQKSVVGIGRMSKNLFRLSVGELRADINLVRESIKEMTKARAEKNEEALSKACSTGVERLREFKKNFTEASHNVQADATGSHLPTAVYKSLIENFEAAFYVNPTEPATNDKANQEPKASA